MRNGVIMAELQQFLPLEKKSQKVKNWDKAFPWLKQLSKSPGKKKKTKLDLLFIDQ